MIDSDVRGSTNEHLSRIHLGEVVHDGSGRDGLSCTRRSLDKTERFLQNFLDGCHLRVVELGEMRSRESLWHLGSKDLRF